MNEHPAARQFRADLVGNDVDIAVGGEAACIEMNLVTTCRAHKFVRVIDEPLVASGIAIT